VPLVTSFVDEEQRQRHFRDHGADVRATDASDYEAKAKVFLEKPLSETMREDIRPSDDCTLRFDSLTSEFAICAPDGTIMTYYKPQPRWRAKPGTPRHRTHRFHTNQDYYDECLRQ
jgi:pyocin large subunit-like protein